MKSFRDTVSEMPIRSVHNEHGDLEELKFGRNHVAISKNKEGVTINSTANTIELKNKELAELINALNKFL